MLYLANFCRILPLPPPHPLLINFGGYLISTHPEAVWLPQPRCTARVPWDRLDPGSKWSARRGASGCGGDLDGVTGWRNLHPTRRKGTSTNFAGAKPCWGIAVLGYYCIDLGTCWQGGESCPSFTRRRRATVCPHQQRPRCVVTGIRVTPSGSGSRCDAAVGMLAPWASPAALGRANPLWGPKGGGMSCASCGRIHRARGFRVHAVPSSLRKPLTSGYLGAICKLHLLPAGKHVKGQIPALNSAYGDVTPQRLPQERWQRAATTRAWRRRDGLCGGRGGDTC